MEAASGARMDGILANFSDALGITPELESQGNSAMQRIFEKLKRRSRFKLDRTRCLGGKEKRTSLWFTVDYDCVIYVNDEEPPFDKVLDEWEDVLLLQTDLKRCDITRNKWMLGFSYEGIDFDLLPATNMAKGPVGDVVRKQNDELLKKIRGSPNPTKAADDNSTGLMEATITFIKQRTVFAHRLAKLCKFWDTTIFCPDKISGRSSIMEIVAIKAADDEEKEYESRASMLRAFRRFLTMMATLPNLEIYYEDYYTHDQIPRNVRSQRPLIMNPSSPYSNFAATLRGDPMKLIMKCAEESIRRLDNIHRQATWSVRGVEVLRELFQQQPDIYTQLPSNIMKTLRSGWIISYPEGRLLQPKLTINSRTCPEKMKQILEHIKVQLAVEIVMQKYISDRKGENPHTTKENSKEKVQEFIDKSIYAQPQQAWGGSGAHFCGYADFAFPIGPSGGHRVDAEFQLPIGCASGENIALTLSFN